MTESEQNQRIARTICDDLAYNGWTFREGQYVALLDGEVISVTDDVRTAIQALRSVAPEPHRGMVLEVAPPQVDIIR